MLTASFKTSMIQDLADSHGLNMEDELAKEMSRQMSSEIDFRVFLAVYGLDKVVDQMGYHKFCRMIGYNDIDGSYEGCIKYIYELTEQYPDLVSFWKL